MCESPFGDQDEKLALDSKKRQNKGRGGVKIVKIVVTVLVRKNEVNINRIR